MGEVALRLRALAIVVSAALVASLLLFVSPTAAHSEETTGSVAGKVTATDTGSPLAGATVIAMGVPPESFRVETVTDGDGHYELTGVPSGSADFNLVAIGATGSGYSSASSNQAPLAADEIRAVDFVLPLAPAVTVTPEPVCLGSTVTVQGSHLNPGDQYSGFWIGSDAVSANLLTAAAQTTVVTIDEDGAFTATFATRADAAPGDYSSFAFEVVGRDSWGQLPVAVTVHDCTITSATPTITGTAGVGFTLTATPGTWSDGTSFGYQWFAGGVAITNATASTLKLAAAQADKAITVKVTGTLAGYTAVTKTSLPTRKVLTPGTPKITGSAATGSTLKASTGTWTTGTAYTYQWFADGTPIAGATTSSFAPKAAQDGQRLTVTVTGSKSGYAKVVKTSAATLKVTRAAIPTVSGEARVGGVLTASRGTWSAGTDITYKWYADGVAISGATTYTVKLSSAQRDKRITVKVTGKKFGYPTVVAASAPTLRVATVAKPSISGTFVVGATLTAKPNTWTSGTRFSYRWFADGVPISGATRSTLVLTSGQRGKQISVTVTGSKSGWTTASQTSSKTVRIASVATPKVGGRTIAGSTLTAGTTGWTPGTTFSYQWYVNGARVSGSGSTLTLNRSHIGKSVKVTVVGKKTGYQTFTRTSAVTAPVSSGKASPASKDNCPSGYPIKGNQTTRHTTDWIYHVPGGRYYAVTDPEECFATESAAVVWGYRRSQQ